MSRISCHLRGAPVSHASPADCHGKPPFWDWWRDYRNCVARRVCLYQDTLTLFSGNDAPHTLGVNYSGPLACTSWRRSGYRTVVVHGEPPPAHETPRWERKREAGGGGSGLGRRHRVPRTVWWRRPVLHRTRLLPGHFGHDMLNNHFYAFVTFLEAGLAQWLEPHRAERPVQFLTDDGVASASPWLETVRYDEPEQRAARHCFDLALLSQAHTHGVDMTFQRASASLAKRRTWRLYRDLHLRHGCGAASSCAAPPGAYTGTARPHRVAHRPLPVAGCARDSAALRIVVLYRTTSRSGDVRQLLSANGGGRRITNQAELVAALRSVGEVEQLDPASLSLAQQQRLLLSTDVLVARMSSTVVNAMYMPPGGVCVEVEAADPSHLYYDHHATFAELADIFGHTFVRSMPDSDAGASTQPVVGSAEACKHECTPVKQLLPFAVREELDMCYRRCEQLAAQTLRQARAAAASTTSGYRRSRGGEHGGESWFMNWWLADTDADASAVAELVVQAACASTQPPPRATRATVSSTSDVAGAPLSTPLAPATDDAAVAAASDPSLLAETDDRSLVGRQQQQQQRLRAALGDCSVARYVPSAWEASWVGAVSARMSDAVSWDAGCKAMRAERPKVQQLLGWIRAHNAGRGAAHLPPSGILSSWTWDECDDAGRAPNGSSGARSGVAPAASAAGGSARSLSAVPIEPLVGHLRHPKFHCVGPERDTLRLMFSTDYLVLPHASQLDAMRGGAAADDPASPPRKLFFDAGASVYGQGCGMGCQRWFVEAYRAKGIEFDRIIGWEAKPVDPTALWRGAEGYPPQLHSRVTYFNAPVSADAASGDNPLTHIEQLARPEDFVVFKLDIDHNSIEVQLIEQLLASPRLLGLVDELFWEHHVHGSPLRRTRVSFMGERGIGWRNHTPARGTRNGGLDDSYRLFSALRKAGIRAHSWI